MAWSYTLDHWLNFCFTWGPPVYPHFFLNQLVSIPLGNHTREMNGVLVILFQA